MQRPTPFIAPEVFDSADAALARVQAIYEQSLNHLRTAMRRYVAGEPMADKVRACYPFVRLQTTTGWVPPQNLEAEWLSYGFVASAGIYATTLTRPDLFAYYLRAQFELLIHNHGVLGAKKAGAKMNPAETAALRLNTRRNPNRRKIGCAANFITKAPIPATKVRLPD